MKRYRVRIERDEDHQNPRTECDHDSVMCCKHGRYQLGDDHDNTDPENLHASLFYDCELRDEEVRSVLLTIIADPDGKRDYCDEFSGWDERYTDRPAFHYDFVQNWVMDNKENLTQDQRDAIASVVLERYVILPLYLYDHSGITMSASAFSCPWDSGQVGYIYQRLTPEVTREDLVKYLVSEVEEYDSYLTGDCWWFALESQKYQEDEEGDELTSEWETEESCGGFLGYSDEDLISEIQSCIGDEHIDAIREAVEAKC